MEAFVATDAEQFVVIKKVIDLCDYYVLIIGKRYGSVNKTTKISYTEMEYNYAIEKKIPILVFAIDESVSLPAIKTESDAEKIEKLRAFREKAMEARYATVWETPADLAVAVALSISAAKTEFPRPGWQRATDYDEASLRREMMDLQKKSEALGTELNKAQQTIVSLMTSKFLKK